MTKAKRTRTKSTTPTAKSLPGINKEKMQALLAGEGSSIAALCEATGWLPHSARAAISGLRKSGKIVERSSRDGVTIYRLVRS